MIVAEEREAISAWALEGLPRLLDQRGYTLPPCHEMRQRQMRRINNSVQTLLEDHSGIELVADGTVKAPELYDIYVQHIQTTAAAPRYASSASCRCSRTWISM